MGDAVTRARARRVVWTRDARDWGWVVEERCVRSVPFRSFVAIGARCALVETEVDARGGERERERERETDPKTTDVCFSRRVQSESGVDAERCGCERDGGESEGLDAVVVAPEEGVAAADV